MSEIVYERIKNNLSALNMNNTLNIIDNDLEKAIHDKTNIDRILHHSQVVSIKGESYRLKEKSL